MPIMYLDESEQGQFLSVGGFFIATSKLPDVESQWVAFKQGLGLRASDVFKWRVDQDVRSRIEQKGYSIDEARIQAAELVAALDHVVALAIVLQERRGRYVVLGEGKNAEVELRSWHEVYGKGGAVRHFYARGVEFALQRFAIHSSKAGTQGEPCQVVLDDLGWSQTGKMTRDLSRKLDQLPDADHWVIRGWMEKGPEALRQAYSDWYEKGFQSAPYQCSPLRSLRFEATFHESHATWSPALQIADFIAGCAAAVFSQLSYNRSPGAASECLRTMLKRFMHDNSFGFRVWGDGIVLYPPNRDLWNLVKNSLQ